MLTPETDLAQLLSRVALGDRAAFEQLYKRTCAHLLGVAVRVLHNTERAEEVLQDAFMNVWHNAAAYNPGVAQPMTWLINIIRNKAIDALRSGKTEASRAQPLDDDSLQVAGDMLLEPQQWLDRSLTHAHINACMSSLSATQRQALALAYYRGMAHPEIAEALAVPLGTAKAWVRRGLEKFKNCMLAAGVQSA
jgi:RNA polymerase sigma-70 factor, ECF subfamily